MELVHQLWLRFRGDASMKELHHSDIVTYALDRLAVQYMADPQEVLNGLRRSIEDKGQSLGSQFAMENRIQKPMLPPDPPDPRTHGVLKKNRNRQIRRLADKFICRKLFMLPDRS